LYCKIKTALIPNYSPHAENEKLRKVGSKSGLKSLAISQLNVNFHEDNEFLSPNPKTPRRQDVFSMREEEISF
jgi:hypothetical protein